MRPEIMGILNITEDSFSDGGKFLEPQSALNHAKELIDSGATIIDIGAESTRPGAVRVPEETEIARVQKVVTLLKENFQDVRLSIDTMRASTAKAALDAGADILNDVSGGLADKKMYTVAAQADVPIILMHWQAETFGNAAGVAHSSDTVVADVVDGFSTIAESAQAAGIKKENIILDPGLGFAKDADSNWTLIKHFEELTALGYPLLIGHSRKRFLQALVPGQGPAPSEADFPTATVAALMYSEHPGSSLWGFRVHNVAATVSSLAVVDALKEAH
ncbi:MAG: dihydropteroate synthase [Corynebacterium sp.]|nr:dihydropteroate synthase [Corynebacterium sp.]